MTSKLNINWLNKCRCGNRMHTVETVRGSHVRLFEDDAVKCNSCGREGVIQTCDGIATVLWETDAERAEGAAMTKSTITRERLAEIAQFGFSSAITPANDFEIKELARLALAEMDCEPVALQPELAKVIYHFRDWNEGFSVERFKADYVISWMLANYPPAQPAPVVPDGYVMVPVEPNGDMLAAAQDAYGETDGDIASTLRAAMLASSPQLTGCDPAIVQGKWIPVSERMPEDEQEVLTINKMGHRFVSFFDKHSGLFFDRLDAPAACSIEHVLVTHWMPLPASPQEVK